MNPLRRTTISVTVLGLVGTTYIRWQGDVRLFGTVTLKRALAAAGHHCRANLLAALATTEPSLLVNGERCPDLTRPLQTGDTVTWIMPLAGG